MNLKTLAVITMCVGLVYGQSSCKTQGGKSGDCVSISECGPYVTIVNKPDKTQSEYQQLLRYSQCGTSSNPKVCCPKESEFEYSINGPCATPDGNPGKCVSLYSCPELRNQLRGTVSPATLAFMQKSKCKSPEQYSVCCPLPPPANGLPVDCKTKMTAYPPHPSTKCCGEESGFGNKIVGANQTGTAIDEYPWMVVIEYRNLKYQTTSLMCGGSLISGKYVLTAGHCVIGPILRIATPQRVRLGEYDTAHEGPDCVIPQSGGEDCTDGAIRVAIEKSIPHPKYDLATKKNDIALIRLSESAPYTDFIRPVCLPTIDRTLPENTPPSFLLFAVGWGATESGKPSNIKLQVNVPFVSLRDCQPAYNVPGRTASLWGGQLCAGGIEGVDSCRGDSGGPLVYQNENGAFEATGIVSFGPMGCGIKGTPGIYTNVHPYLDWIKSVIVP